mmetsp:Transcript_81044/g.185536  ORF Transcript_81044/g.185536 Transcript_81044/m.185536 type:complete len:252 (-) Transcript_81044:1267-2022(-)
MAIGAGTPCSTRASCCSGGIALTADAQYLVGLTCCNCSSESCHFSLRGITTAAAPTAGALFTVFLANPSYVVSNKNSRRAVRSSPNAALTCCCSSRSLFHGKFTFTKTESLLATSDNSIRLKREESSKDGSGRSAVNALGIGSSTGGSCSSCCGLGCGSSTLTGSSNSFGDGGLAACPTGVGIGAGAGVGWATTAGVGAGDGCTAAGVVGRPIAAAAAFLKPVAADTAVWILCSVFFAPVLGGCSRTGLVP